MPGTAKTHPCVFRGSLIREQVDPHVKRLWEDRFGPRTPFGNLRLMFREAHCTVINPYGSETCPYSERSCAIAFYQCVKTTVEYARDKRGAVGYFRAVAKTHAIDRVDSKPLARHATTDTQGPSNARPLAGRDEAGSGVRSTKTRPVGIGEVLRALDLGPRKVPADDGSSGSE